MSQVHARARTTPLTRAEIQESELGVVALAERYNISRGTASKWKNREDVQDRSHRPHKLSTTLSEGQEALVAEVRRLTLIPLDDLLVVVREFINPAVSRSGLDRCLRRHGVGSLRELQAAAREAAGEGAPPAKTFKDYEPGFVHIDIKYLPQMPDEAARRYLFVAIDRATRWVFLRVYADQSEASSVDFLERLHEAAPMKITKALTDNGSQFTDRFTSKAREPSGQHHFDVRCKALGIEHRLCPPRHPQTNGLVERFNGRISEVVQQTRFKSGAELEATLTAYCKTYTSRSARSTTAHPCKPSRTGRCPSPICSNAPYTNRRVLTPTGLFTEIFIWDGVGHWSSSLGHVSTNINGRNYSFGPDGWDKTYASSAAYVSRQLSFRGGTGYMVDLTPEQEASLAECLENSTAEYSAPKNNCGTSVQACLNRVGVGLLSRRVPKAIGAQLSINPAVYGTTRYEKIGP
jgi:transposase InsO family protein